MNGLLSQSIANLVVAEQQVTFLSGLPSAAQQIQSESSSVIRNLIPQIQTMQRAVGIFVAQAIPQFNTIETFVSNNQFPPQFKTEVITDEIAGVQKAMNSLKSTVDGISVQIHLASSQVFSYFNQLATIESDLTAQTKTLQGKLDDAQSEESATKKKYYYLLALGPLGLIGLATALGLYLKWRSDVNDYESQISSLNAQITSLNTLKSNCKQMGTDFQGVITKTSGIQNSVDFLVSELTAIRSDLNEGSSLTTIGIYVKTAITEVHTLGVDAS